MSVIATIRGFFDSPARQAAGWALVGVLGLGAAGGGIWLATEGGSDGTRAIAPLIVETPQPTRTPTRTATPRPTATPTATPTLSPEPQAQVSTGGNSQTQPQPEPEVTEEPTPEPTPESVVAGGPYCPSVSQTATPTRVLGAITIGGVPAPPGTLVTLAFDGVTGPGEEVTIANGVAGFSIDFNAAQGECANRVGAAIGAYVNGQLYASGRAVGDGSGSGGFIRFDIAIP